MRGALLAISLMLASAYSAGAAPLIEQVLPQAPSMKTTMVVFDIPPAQPGKTSTAGLPGHAHPGSTYVYVVFGAVRSRLGDEAERLFKAGEAWVEAPGQAHYLANASESEPARLLVTFVAPVDAPALTTPRKP